MNIYEKIQAVKVGILQANLKKTGKNAYANFDYYELADILPTIIQLCDKHKIFTKITFNEEVAILQIINTEKPEETVVYDSPMRSLELKGCNAIQNLGGIETYQRRYLYMAAFDIVENDMFDAVKENKEVYRCCDCGKEFQNAKGKDGKMYTAKQIYELAISKNFDKKPRCSNCMKKQEVKPNV